VGLNFKRNCGGILMTTKITEKFAKVKQKIREAIINKGVAVSENATLSEMAEKINEIKMAKPNKRKEAK
jgi:DNA polymerase II large subunit